ncbi:MAG: hypothetical protein ACRYF5_18435, partial [Janthinobacterium lividum]
SLVATMSRPETFHLEQTLDLEFSHCYFNLEDIAALRRCCASNPAYRKISLDSCTWNYEAKQSLMEMLAITEMRIDCCFATSFGHFGRELHENPVSVFNPESESESNSSIDSDSDSDSDSDPGLRILSGWRREEGRLQKVNFFKALAKMQMQKCLQFTVSGVPDSPDTKRSRLSAPFDDYFFTDSKLTTLAIRCPGLLASTLKTLAKWLITNAEVMNLDLSYCGIGDSGSRLFRNVLKTNTHLHQLRLAHAAITQKGIWYIAVGLLYNKHLKALDLSGNHIGIQGFELLVEALRKNKTLEVLKMGQVGPTSGEAIKKLCDVLKLQSKLVDIDLSGCDLTAEGKNSLAALLETLPRNFTLVCSRFTISGDGSRKPLAMHDYGNERLLKVQQNRSEMTVQFI